MVAAPEYSPEIQAKIVLALCALHNFIRVHDSDDLDEGEIDEELERRTPVPCAEDLGTHVSQEERERASVLRDQIAHDMWDQYVAYTATE